MRQVNVYSTPTCPYCHSVKDFLKGKGVEFTDYDVSADQIKAKEMVEKSGQMGVPVIEIDGKIVVGFNQSEIEKLLA